MDRPTTKRRQPEQTALYQAIAAHLPTFLARTGGADGMGGWPAFVRRWFEAYLRRGILAHGLLRGGRLRRTSPHVHSGALWPLPGPPAAR